MSKMFSRFFVFFGTAAICSLFASPGFSCGTQRWNVKVVQDQHAKFFFQDNDLSTGILQPFQKTTIAELHREAYPFNSNPRKHAPKWANDQRVGIAEFRIWTVTAILTEKKNEADKDYHFVLKDTKNDLVTMVAEIPLLECTQDTPELLKTMITKVRNDFDKWFSKQKNKKKLNQKVRLTGIGFFDHVHGAKGESPNGIELHPVIKINFLK